MTTAQKQDIGIWIKITCGIISVLFTIIVSMLGYWGNQFTTFMNQSNKHFDVLDSKIATISEVSNGNRANIVTLFIDDGNSKTDLATIKATIPYLKNR